MRQRKLELGSKNLVGARVTEARQMRGMKQVELLARLQTRGIDISIPRAVAARRAEASGDGH